MSPKFFNLIQARLFDSTAANELDDPTQLILVKLPVWLLTYNYGPRNFQVVINGFTGTIAGQYPKSWMKILFAVLGLLTAIGLFALVAANR